MCRPMGPLLRSDTCTVLWMVVKSAPAIDWCINRGYYTRGHFIWNLSNEHSASLINFIWNDHECNIQFIIWLSKGSCFAFKVDIISMKQCIIVTDVVMMLLVPAESVNTRVVITLFMTWRYPLNNSDVIWQYIRGQLDLLDRFLSNVCSCTMGFLDNILNNVNAANLGKRYILLWWNLALLSNKDKPEVGSTLGSHTLCDNWVHIFAFKTVVSNANSSTFGRTCFKLHGIQILSNDHTVHILKYLYEDFQRRHLKT